MMANLYMLIIMLVLFWLQLLFGSIALHVPFCAGGLFYISIAYSWRQGILWALLSGISLDLAYGRYFFISTLAFLGVVIFAEYYLRKSNMRHLRNCILPGVIIALIGVLPVWIYKLIVYNSDMVSVFKDMLPVTIFTLSFNAFMLPLMVLVLDEIGEKVKLPLFTNANKRFLEG
jgi:cell shape-determining protein MreD